MKTLAEQQTSKQTGRPDAVEQLRGELARAWPEAVN